MAPHESTQDNPIDNQAITPDPAQPNRALLHRPISLAPSHVSYASGLKIHLTNPPRTIIDACGGAAVVSIGHGNAEVLAATMEQMRSVSYIFTGTYTTTAAEDLASLILHQNPYGLEKAFFVGSGSEAMDAALKLARQYFWEKGEKGRRWLVARKQSYHGVTVGAMSVSSNLPRKVPYEPLLLKNVSHVSPAYAYQYKFEGETDEEYVARLAGELSAEFERLGPENVIAFIAEPVVGATTGCVPAPPGYFRAVRDICNKHGILLILDEVMCGMGRTGSLFAFEQEGEGVVPDIMTMGKGLGGGYAPIAGVLVNKKVVDVLRAGTGGFNHAQTYQAHAVSCATALAVQKIVQRDGLVERCKRMGFVLEDLLRKKLGGKKYVGDIRGRGLFWGIEFVRDRASRDAFEPTLEFGVRVQKKALELGVAVYPGIATIDGVKGDHVILAPPYTVTHEELEMIVDILEKAYDLIELELENPRAKL